MTQNEHMDERYERWAERERKMRVVGALAFWAGVAALVLTFWSAYDNEVSMAKCQKTQSFDTCYQSLHR